jgi:PAS domain S-box-containing protein
MAHSTEAASADIHLNTHTPDFRQFFTHNPVMMGIIDATTSHFLEVNAAACQHYGYSHAEFLSMTLAQLCVSAPPIPEANGWQAPYLQAANVCQHRRKDGTQIEVRVLTLDMPFANQAAQLVMLYDITEEVRQWRMWDTARQQLEDQLLSYALELQDVNTALAESEKRYRVTSELTSHWTVVSIVDEKGDIHPQWISESFFTLMGFTQEDRKLFTTDRLTLVHPDDIERVRVHVDRLRQGLSDTIELRMRDASGQYRYIRYHAMPERDSHTQVIRIIGAARDITTEKQAEANLLQVAQREHDMLETQRQFIIHASHEFRTPLSVILSSATLLYQYYDRLTPDRRLAHFEQIKQHVKRLVELLDSLHYLVDQEAVDPERSKYVELLLRSRL